MIGRAGGTGRNINPFVLQRMEKHLAAHALKADADDLRRACLRPSLLLMVTPSERFQSRQSDAPSELYTAFRCFSSMIRVRLLCCQRRVLPHPAHFPYRNACPSAGRRQDQNRADLRHRSRIYKNPTPFGPWILWPLTESRSMPCFFGRISYFPYAWIASTWNNVGRIFLLDTLADLLDRLHCSDLVVHIHHRHQDRVRRG